jgi:hypothetical protein
VAALARRDFSWDREAEKYVRAFNGLLVQPELVEA